MRSQTYFLILTVLIVTSTIGGCRLLPDTETVPNSATRNDAIQSTPYSTSPQARVNPSPSEATATTWLTYTNPTLQISFQYPAGWQHIAGDESGEKFAGSDGYFISGAMGGGGMSLDEVAQSEAQHALQPFGSHASIESLEIQGMPARLILPSTGPSTTHLDILGDAELLVQYPQALQVNGIQADFFSLHAPVAIIRDLAASLAFTSAATTGTQNSGEFGWIALPMFSPPNDWQTYTDPTAGFELSYPPGQDKFEMSAYQHAVDSLIFPSVTSG